MNKVIVSFRIDSSLKEMINNWAHEERRTVANFIEDMIHREHDRRNGEEITLEKLDKKLDKLLSFFSENKKRSTKNDKPKEKKETAYDAWEDVGVCTKESWYQWIDHLHKLNVHPNCYEAKMRYFNELCKFSKERWDCDHLIECIIERGHRKFYVPKEWIEAEGRR